MYRTPSEKRYVLHLYIYFDLSFVVCTQVPQAHMYVQIVNRLDILPRKSQPQPKQTTGYTRTKMCILRRTDHHINFLKLVERHRCLL